MVKPKQRSSSSESLVPKALTGRQVKELFENVRRDLRKVAEERRRLGIPDPEAPGLTQEARESRYGCGGPEDPGSTPDIRDSLFRTVSRPRTINVSREREF